MRILSLLVSGLIFSGIWGGTILAENPPLPPPPVGGPSAVRPIPPPGPANVLTETDVLRKVHHINRMEIEAGKLVATRTQSRKVRAFGQKLVRDHEKAEREVAALAKREGIDLNAPLNQTPVDTLEMAKMDRLHTLHGAEFDRSFLRAMAEGHEQSARELGAARDSLKGTRTATLLDKLLPVIEEHRKIALSLDHQKSLSE